MSSGISPKVRWVLYILMGVAQVIAFFASDLELGWADAMQKTANFLGGMSAVTAATNITPPAVQRVKVWRQQRRERPRSV